ncbi:uncharacterized protein TNCV_2299291 [Trichonephila clavipes]|nr:uncharacterized protein TNCV_2299291 [Trichonephila clavipes]
MGDILRVKAVTYDVCMASKTEPITLKGRNIDVAPAFSKKAAVKISSVPVDSIAQTVYKEHKIFVGGLPSRTECIDLQKLFQKYGVIRYTTVLKGKGVNRSSYGFVAFITKESAKEAVKASNTEGIFMNNLRLRVCPAINKSRYLRLGDFDDLKFGNCVFLVVFFKKRSVMSRTKQRSAFDQVSEFDRGRIVAYRDCELSFREISNWVGRNQTTVMRIYDRWMQKGTTD